MIGAATTIPVAHATDPPLASIKLPTATEPAWPSSPFHRATSGATGNPIPCLCRYRDRKYNLGDKVCLQTPNGVMLARCDLFLNNTSWVPTDEACTISWRTPPQSPMSAGRVGARDPAERAPEQAMSGLAETRDPIYDQ
jgi:hypothetical protein